MYLQEPLGTTDITPHPHPRCRIPDAPGPPGQDREGEREGGAKARQVARYYLHIPRLCDFLPRVGRVPRVGAAFGERKRTPSLQAPRCTGLIPFVLLVIVRTHTPACAAASQVPAWLYYVWRNKCKTRRRKALFLGCLVVFLTAPIPVHRRISRLSLWTRYELLNISCCQRHAWYMWRCSWQRCRELLLQLSPVADRCQHGCKPCSGGRATHRQCVVPLEAPPPFRFCALAVASQFTLFGAT